MRWRRWHHWGWLGLLAGSVAASAAEPACGPHVAGLYPFPPFLRETANHGWEGIDKDMFDELARRSGCELRLVVESRVRIWEQMRGGGVALTLSAIPTPERKAFAEFMPYAQGRNYLMLRPDVAQRVKSLAAFEADEALALIVVKGYAHGPTLDAAIQRLRASRRVLEAGDFPSLLRMAAAGRAQALLATPHTWNDLDAALAPGPKWVPLDVAPADRAIAALALSLQMPAADRQRLRQTLQAMMVDGSVFNILRRHIGEAAARAALLEPRP